MYGITNDDIDNIDNKILKQKLFLSTGLIDIVGSNKKLLECTYSANLNPKKYFAEINNRVNTMFNNAKDKGLKPVFVTLTAPSQYHRKYQDGNLHIDPNETAKALTQVWNKFTNLQVFQKMKKELGHGLVYFRVYEPHKSAVPHLHAMIFIPVNYILAVKKKYKEYFSSSSWGANKNAIDFKYTWYKQGGGAVGYIMKYITKTFKDEDTKAVQHAVYWYIKHKVRRFLSSRTLAPLSLYRKVRYYFKGKYKDDFNVVTQKRDAGVFKKLFDDTQILYIYYNHDSGEIEEKILWAKNTDLLLKARANKELELAQSKNQRDNFKYIKPNENKKALVVKMDGIEKYVFSATKNKFVEIPTVPSRLKNFQLYNYFKKLDSLPLEKLNIQHYLITKNEMIKRGMLNQEIQPLNNTTKTYGF
ncbi:MAG: replication endonuclease [Campylobacterota bacterium]|nr:replication endonuclease [Campylobacterota bacterium]